MSLDPGTSGNLGAARALTRMFGGFEAMIEQGTHVADLYEVVYPGDDIDPGSIRQLTELAEIMGIRADGTAPEDGGLRYTKKHSHQEEPLIEPEVAEHWLTNQTGRAIKSEDGNVCFRADQKPDHLGFAAMEIARGEDPRLFSEVYAEVTDNASPIANETLQMYAEGMVLRFFQETQ